MSCSTTKAHTAISLHTWVQRHGAGVLVGKEEWRWDWHCTEMEMNSVGKGGCGYVQCRRRSQVKSGDKYWEEWRGGVWGGAVPSQLGVWGLARRKEINFVLKNMQFWASFGTSFLYYSIRTFSASEKAGGLSPSPRSGGPIPLSPLLRRLWMGMCLPECRSVVMTDDVNRTSVQYSTRQGRQEYKLQAVQRLWLMNDHRRQELMCLQAATWCDQSPTQPTDTHTHTLA